MTAFAGLWNAVVPPITVLVGFNLVLGSVATHLLNRASRIEVR